MSKNIYITATEANTKIISIVISTLNILNHRFQKVGFFRPIVKSSEVIGEDIKLISSQFNIELDYKSMYGITSDEIAVYNSTLDTSGMFSAIIEKYKLLEQECDFILVEGSDYSSHLNSFEFGFNLMIANNLACPIITVVSAKNRSVTQTVEATKLISQIILSEKSKQLGSIVIGANAEDMSAIKSALQVTSLKDQLSFVIPDYNKSIINPIEQFSSYVNIEELIKKIETTTCDIVTPIMFEYTLFNMSKENRKHIVLPEGDDDRVLKAVSILLKKDVVDITLLGNKNEIAVKASALNINLEGANIIDPATTKLMGDYATEYYNLRKHKGISMETAIETMHDVSYFGTMMVHRGVADGMVSGAAHTTQHTIRPAFEFIKTKPRVSIVSSSFFMCLQDRVLVYGDCAVNPNPNAEQLADIAISSAHTAAMFGMDPHIAMLSYSTGVSGKGDDVEKVRDATNIIKEHNPKLKIEGPIQYDAAVDAAVAKIKMPDSKVAGKANVFIFPDLNAGNITYKAVQRSANALAIGPVLQGLNKPVNDLSRGCLIDDIVNTVVITAIQAQHV